MVLAKFLTPPIFQGFPAKLVVCAISQCSWFSSDSIGWLLRVVQSCPLPGFLHHAEPREVFDLTPTLFSSNMLVIF